MKIDRTGCTRIVILWRGYAIKIPNVADGLRLYLKGRLANMQEVAFSKAGWPELCPVLFSLPGGYLLVMPRVRLMSDEEFMHFDAESWVEREDYRVPVERKSNSFGWLNGRLVAIDYGN